MKIKGNKGFTGVDIAVSIVILIIFVSLITTMFYNLSITSKKIERKTIATNLAIQTIEAMKIIDFDSLTETMTINEINNLIENKIEIPNGYDIEVAVDNKTYPDVIKIISSQVNYKNGKNAENVKIETLIKKGVSQIEIAGVYVILYTDGTLGFSNNEQPITGKTISKNYGNIAGRIYELETEVPWYQDRKNILQVNYVSEISPISTSYWFNECSNLKQFYNINNLNTDKVISMISMFDKCTSLVNIDVSDFDTTNVKNMYRMFAGCENLEKINLTGFETKNVTNMSGMFWECHNITEITIDKEKFDTQNVSGMMGMFNDCLKLKSIDVSNFKTSKVEDMSWLFQGCESLTQLDLSSFDTGNVTSMNHMFALCSNLTQLDLKNFNVSKVTDMTSMFNNCTKLVNLNVKDFDTSNVNSMKHTFEGCSSLTVLDLENWKTSNTKDMTWLFFSCTNLKTIYVGNGWNTSQADTQSMFEFCGTSSVTYK